MVVTTSIEVTTGKIMAIEDDVLVIGGGLAGSMAALVAAERDLRVRLLTYKRSTLVNASGLIDVLGYAPGEKGPVVDPFEAIADLPVGHPYERVGVDAVRDGLLFFDAVMGESYRGSHTDANALVPTTGGTVKPTARYPAGVAAGLASLPRSTLLVGFETLPGFDAPLAAARLQGADVPFSVRGVTIEFPGIDREDAKRTRYAHLLDRDIFGEDGVNRSIRATLAERIRPHLDGESRVGLPAILGEENAGVVRRDLEERLGVDVFEVPTGPPSLPGLRLEAQLYDALESTGVRVTTGVPVVGYEAANVPVDDGERRRIDCALVDREGTSVPYSAEEYVLATGGLVGRGIRSDRERIYEPIFDCHVEASNDRYDWFTEDAFGDHPFARFGVGVDRALRPLDADGDPEFANLRAAGAVLAGSDFAAEKSGSGVSIATGYAAGSRAAAEVDG